MKICQTSHTIHTGHHRCQTTYDHHFIFSTDLPVTFGGLAEFPTPSTMLGSTLASCMMSLLSVLASKKGSELTGMCISAQAEESSEGVNKISLDIYVPLAPDHPLRPLLEKSARHCPIHRSLHPDIQVELTWHWGCDQQALFNKQLSSDHLTPNNPNHEIETNTMNTKDTNKDAKCDKHDSKCGSHSAPTTPKTCSSKDADKKC